MDARFNIYIRARYNASRILALLKRKYYVMKLSLFGLFL